MLRAMHSRWRYERMLEFIVGFLVGAFAGIFIMAILKISRSDD